MSSSRRCLGMSVRGEMRAVAALKPHLVSATPATPSLSVCYERQLAARTTNYSQLLHFELCAYTLERIDMSAPTNKRQKGPDGSPVGASNANRSTRTPPTSHPHAKRLVPPALSRSARARHPFAITVLHQLSKMPPTRSTRSTRAASTKLTPSTSTSASINRQASDSHHLRITVKAPPSKLRQAVSGDDPGSDYDSPEPPVRTARSTRNPRTVLDNESDDDQEDEDEEDDDDDDDDAEGEDDDMGNTDMMDPEPSDEDADADADDIDMDSPQPTPSVIRVAPSVPAAKPQQKVNPTSTAPSRKANLKSVEAKEMEDDDEDDDDELSDLQSGDDDLPGAEDDEEDLDSDLEGEDGDATLDLTKLTRRQRAVYDEEQDASLMALSNEAQKKKHLTAEEHAMRRAEMARRRKNLSEKRNEEEKVCFGYTPLVSIG